MRLAERQGVLQGHGVNRIQRFALEVLRVLDVRSDAFRRSQEFRDSIKRAILTNNPARVVDLWPEWFQEEPTTETVNTIEEIEEALEVGGPTTWIMPDEPLTEEEAMRVIAELSRQSSMTLTPDDLDDDSGWT